MKIKNFKAVTLGIILLVSCFALFGCDPGNYNFSSEELAEVTSIELINYDNHEQKHFISWVPNHTSDLKKFDESKMSRIESLAENRISDFINDLCECRILYKYYAYDSPKGKCIKLNYSDGDFLIVWSNYEKNSFAGYIGKFSSSGKVVDFIGCFESVYSYTNLVNDYFQTQI